MNQLLYKEAIIKEIIKSEKEYEEIIVSINNIVRKVINYPLFTGYCNIKDKVIINTTAVELSLGTGGYDFVMFNYSNNSSTININEGHIMKLRYTPYQFKTLSIEEESNKFQEKINNFTSLKGQKIVVGTLHSQVSVFFEGYRHISSDSNKKTVYIMTDAAALPINLSNNIRKLKSNGVIDYTITIGNSYGGDYEAINIYSAIIFAYEVLQASAIMVCMGPGIVGTGTKYGFTGIEQAYILDAINSLGGAPIALPRISFSDKRERHKGLSHHSITILRDIVNCKCTIPYSINNNEDLKFVNEQIQKYNLSEKHSFINMTKVKYQDIIPYLLVSPSTMGRPYTKERYLFDACLAAADYILGGNY